MASEVFALTDEQIVGLAPEEGDQRSATGDQEAISSPEDKPGSPVPQEAPQWLAERMKDPSCGEQATQFWDATQNAQ
jgi:hypothetical protein